MEALILSCGGSPEPLQHCIKNYSQDFVYFLCSNDSVDIAEEIIKQENISDDEYNIKVVSNHESLDDCYAKSREIIEELQTDYENIHVDFTGGTKPMVAGLVLASIGEKCLYTYVGSKNPENRDKKGLGIVLDGFEKIKEQKDPYEVYAVMEFERGMDFFNKYQFSAAKSNFIEASKKLESEKLKQLARTYIKIVDLYDKWDKFANVNEDKITLNKILNEILLEINHSDNISSYLNENYPDFIPQIENNVEFLKLKISKRGVVKSKNVPYYLPDLLNNAYRRIEESKYDDAVARLYRSIELIAQKSLTDENIIEEHVLNSNKEFKINKSDLNDKFDNMLPEKITDMHEYFNSGKTMGVGLKNSYIILQALGSQYASDYLNDEDIKNNLSSRNRSVLAHGLQPVDETMANELFRQVLSYAKKAFPEVVSYMDMADFPKFK